MKLTAAYAGPNWRGRQQSHREDVHAGLWRSLGAPSEVGTLQEVVLARPSAAAIAGRSPEDLLFITLPDVSLLHEQAAGLARAYEQRGITVHWAHAAGSDASANFIFQRDLFFRTREGVILSRPASEQRAIEARWAASTLAALGVPILATPTAHAVFECADALWLDAKTVLVGIGARTNRAGFEFVSDVLRKQAVRALPIMLPLGVQHLLGVLNLVDVDLAVVRRCSAYADVCDLLGAQGVRIVDFDTASQMEAPLAMNFVTLSPRSVLMQAGVSVLTERLTDCGTKFVEFDASEYGKAAGGLACATGILRRAETCPRLIAGAIEVLPGPEPQAQPD
jgi:N-dimethylarginine dimethylaminohydrolase